MAELRPFQFEDFTKNDEPPVLDLALNRKSVQSEENHRLLLDINSKLQSLLKDQTKYNLTIIRSFLTDIAPSLADSCSDKIITDFLERRFADLRDKKKLVLYVHSDNISPIKAWVEKMSQQHGYDNKISVHNDNNLSHSDCRVEWDSGEETFSTQQILEKIRSQLEGVLGND